MMVCIGVVLVRVVDVLRYGGGHRRTLWVRFSQKFESLADMWVGRVEFAGALVCVQGVLDLVVARLVQRPQIVPDLADVWVQSDSTAVGVQGVTVLVDLVVEDTDGAPEGWVTSVAVHGLLVGLVGLVVVLLHHVASA